MLPARCKAGRRSAATHLCPNHGSSLGDTPEGLAQVPAPAHKGDLKVVLVDVVAVICWCQHLQHMGGIQIWLTDALYSTQR